MRPLPLVLIHDLGGTPDDWTTWGLESYLVEQGGFDPRFIRRLEFGYKRQGGVPYYDAQGDLLQIAHRLSDDSTAPGGDAYQIDLLAEESLAAGGPGKVSIVACGVGGIVARYYLSRSDADRWGTRYAGNVDKVILVGTPNLGGCFAGFGREMLRSQAPWRWLRPFVWSRLAPRETAAAVRMLQSGLDALHGRLLREICRDPRRPISLSNLGTLQATSRSFLLRWLNRYDRLPKHVRAYCLAADVRLDVRLRLFGSPQTPHLRLGDLVVSRRSASTIPGHRPEVFTFEETHVVDLAEVQDEAGAADWFDGGLPSLARSRMMQNNRIQSAILDILTRP